jgi:hypothetical protein
VDKLLGFEFFSWLAGWLASVAVSAGALVKAVPGTPKESNNK